MSDIANRFLAQRTYISLEEPLGRVFSVTRETWSLGEDQRMKAPSQTVIANGHTASEAADIARDSAMRFDQHGYDKPSRAWWGIEEGQLHRFLVRSSRKGGPSMALAFGLVTAAAAAAAAAVVIIGRNRKG